MMTTFTIDTDNHITAHANPEEATATTTTPFDTFSSQQEFTELASSWPAKRLLAIWSSLPGVQPIRKFQDRRTATTREAESRTSRQRSRTGGSGRARQA